MSLRLRVVLVSVGLMLFLGLGVVATNHLGPLPPTASFWFGILLMVLGIACIVLRIAVGPDHVILQKVGIGSDRVTKNVLRDGVLLLLAGMALIGIYYGDQYYNSYMAQVQFATAFTRGLEASKARDWSTAADAFSEATKAASKN
jgi:hypothetical protein